MCTSKIINVVMGSAAEAEVGELYMNKLELSPMETTSEELYHPQPPAPIQTDNSLADKIMNKTIKQRQSKAVDNIFYWLQNRVKQGEFRVFWPPGKDNLADYYIKYHSPAKHSNISDTSLYKLTQALKQRMIKQMNRLV